MAILPDADRQAVWADFMRALESGANITVTKTELRDAINAADDWIDLNAASYNLALPLPVRTSFTAKQKAKLLMWVIRRRFEVT